MSALLEAHPLVDRLELVGSRARGDPTELSDWDYVVHTRSMDRLELELPHIVLPLRPLAQLWDPLTPQALFMLVLHGPQKIDLFLQKDRALQSPWAPSAANLATIDYHFWDWLLWMGSKALRGQQNVVIAELMKMHGFLLGPMGVRPVPSTLREAADTYFVARATREAHFAVVVPRELGDEVISALQANDVLNA